MIPPHNTASRYIDRFIPYLYNVVFAAVFLYALIFRVAFAGIERLGSDEALYAWYAKTIFNSPSTIFSPLTLQYHPPLFSVLLVLSRGLPFPEMIAYRIMTIAIDMIGVLLIYLIGTAVRNRFLGLLCAIFLAFNYSYLLWGVSLTADIPLTVVLLLLFYHLLKRKENSSVKAHIIIGLLASLAVALKWSGLVVIPLLILNYIFVAHPSGHIKDLERINMLMIPLSICGLTVLVLATLNRHYLGTWTPDLSAVSPGNLPFTGRALYYFRNMLNIVLLPFFRWLLLYGVISAFLSRSRQERQVLYTFFLLFFLVSLTPATDWRYSLLFMPFTLLLSGIGTDTLIEKFLKRPKQIRTAHVVVLVFTFIFLCLYVPRLRAFMNDTTSRMTGYKDAGRVIRSLSYPGTTIIAECPRMIRYYSGLELKKYGGNIVELPRSPMEFKQMVESVPGPVILEVDFWAKDRGPGMPAMIARHEEQQFFAGYGFELVDEIRRVINFANRKPGFVRAVRIYKRQ